MTTAPTANAPVADTTASDMFLSLNGFDEIAVAKAFGADIGDLRENPFRFLRALVFVHERRGGAKDGEAYKTAMSLTIEEAGDYFIEEPDEPEGADLDDDPSSAEGNDAAPSS